MVFSKMEYKRIDYDKSREAFETILNEFKAADTVEAQLAAIRRYFDFKIEIESMTTIANIRHTINTLDKFYSAENDYYDETSPKFEAFQKEFNKVITTSKFRPELEKKLGGLLFKNAEINLKTLDEKIIPDMVEENKLTSEYQNLIASAQIDFDGKKNNLSQLQFYMNSPDREIRKQAFQKRTEFFMENSEKLDEIYDQLVKVRTRMAQKLGYKNYVELGYYRMTRNCYGVREVEKFHEFVKKYIVPFCSRLYEEQRKRLGLDKFQFYDEKVFFKEGNPLPKGTADEMFAAGKRMYHEMSKETGEFIDFMLDNELFDVLGRKGKAAGGYMTFVFKYKEPFIFANFNGTHDDVDVLTHEAGHAFESYLAKDIYPTDYIWQTSDGCEVHSMSMEFFAWPWTKLFFGDDADKYHYLHLAGSLQFIPYGSAVDEFQQKVYENPEMTPRERKELWKELEKEYLPLLDYDNDPFFGEGGLWQRQLHIYLYPFYYNDYCLAQLCALQFWALSLKNRDEAWKKYLDYCHIAGTQTFLDAIKSVGIQSPFEESTIKAILNSADEWFKTQKQ